MGHLIFNSKTSDLQIKKLLFPFNSIIGENTFWLSLKNNTGSSQKIRITTQIGNKKRKKEVIFLKKEKKKIPVDYSISEKKSKRLTLIIENREKYVINLPLNIKNPLSFLPERDTYFTGEKFATFKANLSISKEFLFNSKLKILQKNQENKILKEKVLKPSTTEENIKIDISNLKPGNYKIECNLYISGKLIASSDKKLTIEGGPFEL